jgi:hypothetical protein
MVCVCFHIFMDQNSLWSTGKFSLYRRMYFGIFLIILWAQLTRILLHLPAGECVFCHLCLDEYTVFLHYATSCPCCGTFLWLSLPRVRFKIEELLTHFCFACLYGDFIRLLGYINLVLEYLIMMHKNESLLHGHFRFPFTWSLLLKYPSWVTFWKPACYKSYR